MDTAELRTTVEMAMLALDEEQEERLQTEVGRMLDYFAIMSGVSVDGVEPTTHAQVVTNRVRADVVAPLVDADELLGRAPELEERLITIPNVL